MHRALYLRPSASSAWSRCAGYAALNAKVGTDSETDDDNEVREDGLACHWLAYATWTGACPVDSSLAPNGRELTEEMFSAVEDYHAVLRSWPAPVVLEQLVPVSSVMPNIQDGTPDAYAVHRESSTLYLADLKYGFRPVEVWRNTQLIIYAWTLMALSGCRKAELVIVQPRCPHRNGTVRTWRTTVDELRPLAEWLIERAAAALADNPQCTPNPSCRNCAASAACSTLQAAALDAVEIAYDATPHILTPVEVGYELTKLYAAQAHIDNRINGLSTQAESLHKKGSSVPGFTLERAATRWRWREGAEPVLQQLGMLLGVPVFAEPKLRSPAQLRNAFPPALDVQSLYAERPTGELRLKATDPNEAIKAFTQR